VRPKSFASIRQAFLLKRLYHECEIVLRRSTNAASSTENAVELPAWVRSIPRTLFLQTASSNSVSRVVNLCTSVFETAGKLFVLYDQLIVSLPSNAHARQSLISRLDDFPLFKVGVLSGWCEAIPAASSPSVAHPGTCCLSTLRRLCRVCMYVCMYVCVS
jgi:hypothetical protein